MDLKQTIARSVVSACPLYSGDLPANANKSILVGEIEPKPDLIQLNQKSNFATHVMVDFKPYY